MKHVLVVVVSIAIFSLNLFGVDATLKIEKDVENRARIALVDGSSEQSSKVFDILLSDLKISGHFLPDTTHHIGDVSSNYILPALKGQEYVLKYTMNQQSGSKLFVRLLKASDGTQIFKKSYA
ncbi:MAG: Tol-Pal system protein TolB, partial [Epsilonproteobacteria bacterium]